MMLFTYTSGMNSLKERLLFVFEKKPGLTKTGLWKACKLSSGSVSHWFSGGTKELKGDNLLNAAEYLGVNPDWLAKGKGDPFSDGTKIKEIYDKPKDHLSDLLTSDPQKGLEQMLLECYRGCKGQDRDLLLSIANQLFARARPNDKKAAPFGRRKTDVEVKKDKQKNIQ